MNSQPSTQASRRIVHDQRPRLTISRAAQLANTTPSQIYKHAIPGNLFEWDKEHNAHFMFKSDLPELVQLLKDKAPGDVHIILEGAEMITLREISKRTGKSMSILYNLRSQGRWPKKHEGYMSYHIDRGQRMQVLKFNADVVEEIKQLLNQPKVKDTPMLHSPVSEAIKEERARPSWLTFAQISAAVGLSRPHLTNLRAAGMWPAAFKPRKGFAPDIRVMYFETGVIEALKEVLANRPARSGPYKNTAKKPNVISILREQTEKTPTPQPQERVQHIIQNAIDDSAKITPSQWEDVGVELIANGHRAAGLWILKTKA